MFGSGVVFGVVHQQPAGIASEGDVREEETVRCLGTPKYDKCTVKYILMEV